MSVQVCEGVWRSRCGQRVVVTQCDPVDGQQWTDGVNSYSDNGSFCGDRRQSPNDLVSFVGLLPDSSQRAPVSRPAETESTTAVAGGVSDDPGRIIYNLEQRLEAAKNRNKQAQEQLSQRDQTINDQTAEIGRLQTDWKTEFTASQQLRSENDRLQAEALQAQKYVSDANEKINQQTRTIEHLSDKVRSLERFNDDKESDLDHLRQLRRTNEAIIKELRTLLTYALSKK